MAIYKPNQPLHLALMSCNLPLLGEIAHKQSLDNGVLMKITYILGDFSQRRSQISPLQAAVMAGNYRICKKLLHEGADTLSLSLVMPPLNLALDLERFQIARLLIDSGANVSMPFQGFYPMFHALKPNTPEFIVEAIIKAGFSPDCIIEEKDQCTALHKAIACKNVDVINLLMRYKANCNIREKSLGLTPLHVAVNEKLQNVAKILIDNGADLELEANDGFPPLFHAIYNNDLSFVNFLLQFGADVHHLANSKNLIYPLNYSANLGNKEIVKALLKQGADPTRVAPGSANLPIHCAAMSHNIKSENCAEEVKNIVELLIEQGTEVDVPNKYNLTPVQLAIKQNNFKVAEILIKSGAAVNRELTDEGTTNFHLVAKNANKELVLLFLEYGADYTLLDKNKNTPYQLAVLNPDPDVLSIFWKFGCPFDLPKSVPSKKPLYTSDVSKKLDFQRILMSGIRRNDVDMMRHAFMGGAEAKSISEEIPSPLHFAVSNGFSSVVLLLIENGVPSNSINDKGESPLHIAASRGYFQISRYLLRYGACYDLPTKLEGKTPLQLALENNHYDLMYILREIDLMFKSSVNTSFEGLQETFSKSNNVHSLQAYINCINKRGNTLMAVALKRKNIELAEKLMNLRLQIIKA